LLVPPSLPLYYFSRWGTASATTRPAA